MRRRELDMRGKRGMLVAEMEYEENTSFTEGASALPRLVSTGSAGRTRRGVTQLRIPRGKPDVKALKRVTDEWLVPLLVREFLDEYMGRGVEVESALISQVPPEKEEGKCS